MTEVRRISIVVFDGFELLDVFGPVGLFGQLPDLISVEFVGPAAGPVRSSQGTEIVATVSYDEAATPDVVLVPGGKGTRSLVSNDSFVTWLGSWAKNAEMVTSVCTGSALLAASGLLDGYRATTNKRAFEWATSQSQAVEWVAQARWVEDRDRWTSSGVAAGMDMAAALLAHFFGEAVAGQVSGAIELEVHTDSTWDPFAAANGLA
ncbi:DJ-1/PfpI family protein [Rhodococcus sp. P1Y]|uniref:DJ-1/PfpI family protein n=1 Tax=Rhodococcus sp. P1Y TaxID=1302308 RepID=UPI000EB2EF4C|nr:DJ-1/PfpI family protein [Rhodococcus sp. P1Y]AYJ47306.1 DJ-1/PfpI family protein [Rhodococcus sp. P1Y]